MQRPTNNRGAASPPNFVGFSSPIFMNFEIAIVKGKWAGLRKLLTPNGQITIGREPTTCDFIIDDPLLSRKHCTIESNGQFVKLKDLNSRNGTFVNGQKVQEYTITSNDEIKLGHHILQLLTAKNTSEPISQIMAGLCGRCQKKIFQKDLLSRRAVRQGNRLYCMQCIERGIPTGDARGMTTGSIANHTEAQPQVYREVKDELTVAVNPDLPPNTPPKIGHYQILEVLGEGGMGYVYKVRHSFLNTVFAIKVIKEEFVSHAEVLERFLQEARVGVSLDHPHIVKIFDADEVEGIYYIRMEFFPGQNLAGLVKEKGVVDFSTITRWGTQLADALNYAHQQQIIHRDVKPSNVLVNPEGLAKLADFGLAKAWQKAGAPQLTRDRQMLGTIQYISPEQLKDSKNVDPRADIFSLAATLYFSLVGIPPFGQEPLGKVMHNIIHADPFPIQRQDIPKNLQVVLFKAMEKDPNKRFASMAEFRDALMQTIGR